MPFVTERWLGGMLTNFSTIKKSIRKMQSINRGLADGTFSNITKKERLVLTREKDKLERVLGGIADLNRIPSAIFLVDIGHEHIALAESKKLRMTTFGMVDTNSDPNMVNFAIPSNDDASKSIELIANYLTDAIEVGLNERKKEKEMRKAKEAAPKKEEGEAANEEKKAEAQQ